MNGVQMAMAILSLIRWSWCIKPTCRRDSVDSCDEPAEEGVSVTQGAVQQTTKVIELNLPKISRCCNVDPSCVEGPLYVAFDKLSGLLSGVLVATQGRKRCNSDSSNSSDDPATNITDLARLLDIYIRKEFTRLRESVSELLVALAEEQAIILRSAINGLDISLIALLFNPTTPVAVTPAIMSQVKNLTRAMATTVEAESRRILVSADQRAKDLMGAQASQFRSRIMGHIANFLSDLDGMAGASYEESVLSFAARGVRALDAVCGKLGDVFCELESAILSSVDNQGESYPGEFSLLTVSENPLVV